MQADFYSPTLFKYAHAYAHKSLICQSYGDQNKKSAAPLQPIIVEEPFQQWGLDVIGKIFPHSSRSTIKILTATNYFT